MSSSIKRMILQMFEEDYQYFPSLREIRDGLIKAQIQILQNASELWDDDIEFESLKNGYTYNWKILFNLSGFDSIDKPLS